MHFYVNDVEDFARKSNTQLIESRVFYTQARKMLSDKLSLFTKISMNVADRFGQARIIHLKL